MCRVRKVARPLENGRLAYPSFLMDVQPVQEPTNVRTQPEHRKRGVLSVRRVRYSTPVAPEHKANFFRLFDLLRLDDDLLCSLEKPNGTSKIEGKRPDPSRKNH